ncbi:MAG: DUF4391 domain-containing protein [Atopobiaceae bacterium]|nr:DUF4391 domain-containing protein [Atopobiaceae bacterium]
MLGLPSTTEVSQRIPKEAFYRNMDLDARTREQFVSGVDRIVVRNAIRPDTANIASGERVREILVVEVTPKAGEVPEAVAQTVLRANPNPMVVTDGSTGRVWARSTGRTVASDGLTTLSLAGPTMDEAWDSILAQVAFREEDGRDVGVRLERREAIELLEREVETLDRRCRRERQIARRNELFAQLRRKQAELAALKEEA